MNAALEQHEPECRRGGIWRRLGRVLTAVRNHRRLAALAVLLVCYALFWMAGGCADRFVLFPSRQPEDARAAIRRTIPFEGGELEAWVARSPGAVMGREPEAYVITFVGNAGRAEWIAWDTSDWREKPVEVWTINHPGFGGSTGEARLWRYPKASIAAYDHVSQIAGTRPIYVTGASLGAAMAMHVAAERPVAGVVLRTPPPLRTMIQQEHGWWNLWLLSSPIAYSIPAELDAVVNARKCKSPAIFLMADNDEVVPFKYQQMIFDAYAGEKQAIILRGSTHNAPLDDARRGDLCAKLDWLWQQSKQVAGSR